MCSFMCLMSLNVEELVHRLFSAWACRVFAQGSRMMLTSELAYEKPVTNVQCEDTVWHVLTSIRGEQVGGLWGLPRGYCGPLCEHMINFTWTLQIFVRLDLRMVSHWWLQSAREWCREGCRLCCSGGRRDWSLGSAPCSSSTTPAGETKQLAWLSLNV